MMDMMNMMKRLEAIGDISVMTIRYGYIITINDCDGFDEYGHKIERKLELPNLLVEFLNKLEGEAREVEGKYYKTYFFEEFFVCVDYKSYKS